MGKHNRNQHNRSLQERLSFDQEDARLKLLNKNSRMVKAKSTSNAIRDAREILANKNKSLSPNAKSRRRPLPPRKKGASASVEEPLMIITGLDNVRRDGNRVKVVSRPNPEKTVVMDGKRTLITLRNTNASSPSKSNGKQNSSKPRSSSGNNRAGHINNYDDEYKLISVKIKNDLATGASASSSSSQRRATSPSPSHFRREEEKALYDKRRGSNAERARSRTPSPQRTSHSSHYSSQSRSSGQHYRRHDDNNDNGMDYESSSASNRHDDNPNGYKIVVSNLHPRVTEEDILELFSDIGPIKRARFLDKGIAEVLYVKIEHAKEAIYKYDKNELDGRQMRIELVGSSSSSRDQNGSSKSNSNSSSSHHHHHHSHHRSYENEEAMMDEDEQPVNSLSNKFKLLQRNEATSVQLPESSRKSGMPHVNVDSRLVQQVLFNKADSSDITFTVKL